MVLTEDILLLVMIVRTFPTHKLMIQVRKLLLQWGQTHFSLWKHGKQNTSHHPVRLKGTIQFAQYTATSDLLNDDKSFSSWL